MGNVIVALSTPPLKSALALIRASGNGVFEIVEKFFSKKITPLKERKIFIGDIVDEGEKIDFVEVLAYPGPNTMTGEDLIEISCHGSMLIANEIISCFLKYGAQYATRGEFSSRAFFNGKMDLIEAEAVNDLINATSKESKKLSLLSLKGETSKLVGPLKKELGALLALVEVNIDYPEYTDIEEANVKSISEKILPIRENISSLIKQGLQGQIVKEGLRVAIVGAPNAGKSSLLNALMNEDKAIVSDIPGTTRDIVEGDINLKGITLHLLDTAGIRSNAESIEKIGIERSKKSIENADMVIHVIDASVGEDDNDIEIVKSAAEKTYIKVYNKKDLYKGDEDASKLYISAQNRDISPLIDKIYEVIGLSDEAFETPSLNNVRQLNGLRRIDACLAEALEDCKNEMPIDLISANLMSAYNGACELLGENVTLDLTDEIFSRFCVGK